MAAATTIPAGLTSNPFTRAARSLGTTLRLMARSPAGLVGLVLVALFVLMGVFGPILVSQTSKPDVTAIYAAPSAAHLLSTDSQGRDVLAQVIRGGRVLLLIAVIGATISTLIAMTLGSLAAVLGGGMDSAVVTVTDFVLTIPQTPLLFVLAGFLHFTNPLFIAVIIGLLDWPGLTRAIRAQLFSLKERDYIEAARSLGLSTRRIMFSELLPNMMAYIVINFALSMVGAIYQATGLYFLGFAPLVGDNWGIMINLAWTQGAIFFQNSLAYILAPVAAIVLVSIGLVMLSRSMEEVFNPRLRGGA